MMKAIDSKVAEMSALEMCKMLDSGYLIEHNEYLPVGNFAPSMS